MTHRLTKYQSGSLRELWIISFPMILTSLSSHLMIFIDRLILSHYSLTAMSSVAATSTTALAFILAFTSIASISEVFVGQKNGAKKYKETSRAVWQMVWLSIFSILPFLLVSYFASPYIIPDEVKKEGLPYFIILMNFGFLYPLIAALSGFFVGIGKTKAVSIIVFAGNILNLVLDVILVFGIDGVVPAYGVEGAAYATVLSQALQVAIFFWVFFSHKYREKYRTLNFNFSKSIFKNCFKIGFPGAISHVSELSAWAVIFFLAAEAGTVYLTTLAVGQTMLLLFMFLTEGAEKGVIAITSNLIGSKRIETIGKMLRSAIKMYGVILVILGIPLLFYPELLIKLLDIDDAKKLAPEVINHDLVITLRFIWGYFVFDALVWILAGVLTAAGDTKFIMLANSLCAWLFGVVPFYILIYHFKILDPSMVWSIFCVYAIFNLILVYGRYLSAKWKCLSIES